MLGRTLRMLVVGYLIVGIATTAINEVIALLQGSSVVVGSISRGESAATILTAIAQWWVLPIFTWPVSVIGWALRQLSAHSF